MKRERTSSGGLWAWCLYDWANSAFSTIVLTFVFAAYFTRRVATNETLGSSLWGQTLGLAGLVVALAAPVIGAIIDQTGRRKPWIFGFTLMAVTFTASLWFVRPSPDFVPLALVAIGLSVIGADLAMTLYNAMLPTLVSGDRIGRWSGWGWGLGYVGGLVSLSLALLGFARGESSWLPLDASGAQDVRAIFLLAAAWYLVFSLPMFLLSPDAPATGRPWQIALRDGLRQLRESIRHARRYSAIVRFLVARMIYVDGLATMFAYGGAYAAGAFDMDHRQVMLFGILLNITAGAGAIGFAWVDDWIGSKATVLLGLVGLAVCGTTILLVEQRLGFWIGGGILGVFVGPVQAASRSFLSRIAPEELRNQLFGLYALSGKATAFAGPLLVGWITYLSGSQRVGMSVIVILLATGGALLVTVPSGDAA